MNKFYNSKIYQLIFNNKYILLLIMLLLGMSLVLYKSYIFGGRLFLFEDFGSDTVRVSLPTYLYYFDWFKNGMPLWSDKMGIGTSILSHGDIIFDPFTYILFLFGRNSIIYMFIYLVITKIILAGMFFWLFLGKYKLSFYAKIIGSLAYAFGGYMIVTGQNYVFSTIYVYLPLILLGFEIWLQSKKKWLLVTMLTLTALYFFYFFYMTVIFLGIYAVFRYFIAYSFRLKHFIVYTSYLIGYCLLSLGLSAFFWLPSLILTLSNLRIGSFVPVFNNMFAPDLKIVATALGRFFGYDVFGNTKLYLGYNGDYFQLALFCGVITLLIATQIFTEENKRKKLMYCIFSIVLLALLFIPFFPYVFNGFSDFTFRWTYVLHFSFALFLAIAIDRVFAKLRINFKILFVTIAVWLLISLFVVFIVSITTIKGIIPFDHINFNDHEFKNTIIKNLSLFYIDYVFIIAYISLIILFFRTRYKNIIKIILLIFICIDLLWFPQDLINNRLTTAPDPVRYRLGYFDYTNDAVNYLNSYDKSIYRIDKSYDSVISEYGHTPSNNDALAQGYRGLKSYNANNQPNYIRFLINSGIFVRYLAAPIPVGTKPDNIKYIDFHYINGVGDRYLLQSFLGVKYYLTKSDDTTKLPTYYHYQTNIDNINIYKNEFYLPFGFTFDSFITQDEFMQLDNSMKDLALLSFAVVDHPNELSGILNKNNAKILSNIKTQKDISDLIKIRRADVLKIQHYKDDNIKGSINVSRNKILILTIPYDQGWEVFVDNNKVVPIRINNGLIGVKLTSGSHNIVLKYFPPKMLLGIAISFFTLFLLILINKNIIINTLLKTKKQLISFKNQKIKSGYRALIKFTFNMIILIKKQFRKNFKKSVFYTSTLFGLLLFILGGLVTRGYSFYNLFSPDKKDYFMDFFNVLRSLFNGPYTYGSIYPPFPLLINKILLRLIPFDIVEKGAHAIRASQSGQIVLLFYTLVTLLIFFALIMEVKKGLKIEKYLFIFVMLLSAPFLFVFERANIIFVALFFSIIFVFFKDSRNRFVREFALVSLAISGAIKIYPLLFGLLLIKEKRYRDVIKVFIYSVSLFILPFFALGGLGQAPLLIRNILITSNYATEWGLGESINIQNLIRILFGFINDFGQTPILIGRFISLFILGLGLVSAFFLRSKWKTVALLTLIMILVPVISYEYVLIFMIIPLIMFLDSKNNGKPLDNFYLACFILLFLPLTLDKVDVINKGFEHVALPLTYGVLIQSITLFIMAIFLIKEGLMEDKLKFSREFISSVIFKIYSSRHKGFRGRLITSFKIFLTLLVALLLLGDSIFSAIYNDFKETNHSNPFVVKGREFEKPPYIYSIEPYYLHLADKVVVKGFNFKLKHNKHIKFMSSYGEVVPLSWTDSKFIFPIPLSWKPGKVKIWTEKPAIYKGKNIISNNVEITVVDRLGKFNNDDIRYFGQIKYLGSDAREINNFANYKLREYKFSRWIPSKFFQIYADIVELREWLAKL